MTNKAKLHTKKLMGMNNKETYTRVYTRVCAYGNTHLRKIRAYNTPMRSSHSSELHCTNHSILNQSELIRVFFISYDTRELCFCSLKQNKLAFDCTFQSYSFIKNIAPNLDHV